MKTGYLELGTSVNNKPTGQRPTFPVRDDLVKPEGLSELGSKAYVSTEFTIHCGGCLEWDRTSAVSRRKAGVAWKDAGWRFTRKKGWLCPTCMKGN